ncbi:MAG: glycoside hydrolase family protein [Flavobacteriaceae bacterium]
MAANIKLFPKIKKADGKPMMEFNFWRKLLFMVCMLLTLLSCKEATKNDDALLGRVDAVLADAPSGKMLKGPSILGIKNKFVWGGSVVKGDDDKYHMFFSFWDCGPDSIPFTSSWVLRSRIGYAVSNRPDRDFKVAPLVLGPSMSTGNWNGQSVHNPHIKKFNDTYYLYFTGSSDIEGYPEITKRNRVQQRQQIGVIAFTDFEALKKGEYKKFNAPILGPRTRVKPGALVKPSPEGTVALPDNIITVNPSVVYNPNTQKYMLYFKGNMYVPEWRGVHGVAISDHPTGPFTTLDHIIFDVKMPDGSTASSEDPYVWYDDTMFKAVVKDFSGQISGNKKGLALLVSKDGLEWTPAQDPLFRKRELVLRDGQKLEVDRLERPQLYIEDGVPKVMYAACSLADTNTKVKGGTFNVQIPLK